jgi:GNAT superfamily N-acetyltransferase
MTASRLRFLARNIWLSRSLDSIPPLTSDRLRLQGVCRARLPSLDALFASAPRDVRPTRDLRSLYESHGNRLALIAESCSDAGWEVAAADLYYFNERDGKESTIHEGLLFVREPFRSLGISNAMRRHALAHFGQQGICGISTRIRQSNTRSLRSAEACGFRIVESRFLPDLSDIEHYMIARAGNSSK